MRRSTLALVALSLCASLSAACGEDPLPPPAAPAPPVAAPPPPPTTEPPPAPAPKLSLAEMQKQGLGTALQGINSHDPKMFASVYADSAVINVAGLNEVNGRDAIAANMAEWFETFSNAKLGFSRVWVKGDAMVIEWVINGVHHGALFGVKGTEQPIGHYGLSVVQFSPDGKVVREERYGDLGTVMTQVGGAKAKPRPIPEVPKGPETIASTGNEEKNVDVAKAALTALETKKEADFTGALTDDVEHDGLFHLETTKGKDEAKKFFKSFTTAFPDAKFEVTKSLAIGDYAIVESTLKATHAGALGTIKPTKKPIAVHLVDIFKIKDGKVARVWTYQNSLEMQQQLGLFNVAAAGNVPASQAAPKPAGAAPAKPAAAPAPAAPKSGGGGGTGGGGGNDTGGGGGKGTGGGGGGKK
ncbi:MAG: ester cyclase [Labilithrix sp.]|nr:ester cyclase [Labilithrix sp.]